MIYHGDCVEVMAGMPEASVDAICTDPPYGIGFMGKAWDALSADAVEASWSTRGRNTDVATLSMQGKEGIENFRHSASGTGYAPPNPRCGNCGRTINGRDTPKGFKVCHCPEPIYAPTPNRSAQRSQQWHEQWARAAFRVAKPGAYLLAFGGTRTVHRLTCALEDAGWIIRDTLVWAYASGFPKSRSSLKPSWEPIVLARKPGPLRHLNIEGCRIVSGPTATIDAWESDANLCALCAVDAASPERLGARATRASTTRKPAAPPLNDWAISGDTNRPATGCSHGMTPVDAGSSSSTAESGKPPTAPSLTGSLSTISTGTSSTTDSRICTCCGGPITHTTTGETPSDTAMGQRARTTSASTESGREPSRAGEPSADRRYADEAGDFAALPGPRGGSPAGRWPPNLLLTDPIFDGGWDGVVGGAGETTSGSRRGEYDGSGSWSGQYGPVDRPIDGDTGTYSRFFLIPKSARAEREPVFGGLEERDSMKWAGGSEKMQGVAGTYPDGSPRPPQYRRNHHPTVKPLELMRHLVRLVTPIGGTVLDPFLGSGTTAIAAEMEGFAWIGIEKEAEARLQGVQRGLGLDVAAPTPTYRPPPDSKMPPIRHKGPGLYSHWERGTDGEDAA